MYSVLLCLLLSATATAAVQIDISPTAKSNLEPYLFPRIIVRTRPPQAVERKLSGEESRQMAGAGGDVLRATAALPGVQPQNDYLANLMVRGSSENDNLILWDDFPLGYPFHFAGLESVVPAALVENVSLLSGGWDARWGDAQGGVLELQSPLVQPGLSGSLGVSAIQAAAHLQYGTQKIRAKGSFRSGFLDWVLNPGPSLVGLPRWQDYFAGLEIGEAGQGLSLVAFGAQDSVSAKAQRSDFPFDPRLAGEFGWYNRFDTLGLSYTKSWEALQVKAVSSFTRSRLLWQGNQDVRLDQQPDTWRVKLQADYKNGRHRLNTGMEWVRTDTHLLGFFARLPVELGTSVDYESLGLQSVDGVGGKAFSSLWLQDRWEAVDQLWISIGTRMDKLDPQGEVTLSPRLFVEARPIENLRLSATMGDYYQSPAALETVPGWVAPGSRGTMSRVYSAGVNLETALGEWGAEAYSKNFEKRFDRQIATAAGLSGTAKIEFNAADSGMAQGLELLWRLPQSQNFNVWLSWDITQSLQRLPDGSLVDADFSQPHILQAVLMLKPWSAWTFSLNHRAAMGTAYTPILSRSFNSVTQRWEPVFGDPNSARLPWYQRTDGRIEYALYMGRTQIRLFYEVFNIGDSPNETTVTYKEDYSDIQKLKQFPRIHFGGMELLF